jgi:hypothetical protein
MGSEATIAFKISSASSEASSMGAAQISIPSRRHECRHSKMASYSLAFDLKSHKFLKIIASHCAAAAIITNAPYLIHSSNGSIGFVYFCHAFSLKLCLDHAR